MKINILIIVGLLLFLVYLQYNYGKIEENFKNTNNHFKPTKSNITYLEHNLSNNINKSNITYLEPNINQSYLEHNESNNNNITFLEHNNESNIDYKYNEKELEVYNNLVKNNINKNNLSNINLDENNRYTNDLYSRNSIMTPIYSGSHQLNKYIYDKTNIEDLAGNVRPDNIILIEKNNKKEKNKR